MKRLAKTQSPPPIKLLNHRDPRGYEYALIHLRRLVPDPENPRIPPQESVLDTLLALERQPPDFAFTLAKDIVAQAGTNPAELLNVSPLPGGEYLVREGNRRVAVRRILHNVEQLRGQVAEDTYKRWSDLASSSAARALPPEILCVIGENHDVWVDRRHLGPQGGAGVLTWDPQAKARRAVHSKGAKHLTLALLEHLQTTRPERFGPLTLPPRTFTTFERIIDTLQARAHIGIDVDEHGEIRLNRGEQSLQLLEQILRDVRKEGAEKVTSRTLHTEGDIIDYLGRVEDRTTPTASTTPIALGSARPSATARPAGTPPAAARRQARPVDPWRSLTIPGPGRLRKLYDELGRVRKADAPNAATILVRVLLELATDTYASKHGLTFAGDEDARAKEEIKAAMAEIGRAQISLPKTVRDAIKRAGSKPVSLSEKLELALQSLVDRDVIPRREGESILRGIREHKVVDLLNDAVHRVNTVPTMGSVDHLIEVLTPLFNGMLA